MKKISTFYTKQFTLLLAVVITHHYYQANSASIDSHLGSVFSGVNRKLRTRAPAPPAPKLNRVTHQTFNVPPPPPPSPPLPLLAPMKHRRKVLTATSIAIL
ncbi:hypothetical protein M8C21_004190 [Ambrosia artemisiifolia]|uniref:Uncharacterized protein n=1 Tax=Ambrosia artemisiifolia TaxID=4212 RepID=A0AAD5BMV1_AMBAR|nr:hypothetical protein M8C21_004190 [Ambrosia artemisiifolia]